MPLNQSSIFPPAKEFTINYNWVDMAAGTGYVLYYLHATKMAAGTTYHLTPSNYMDTLTGEHYNAQTREYYKSANAAGAGSASIDLDFDTTTFQHPVTIKGNAVIRFGWMCEVAFSDNVSAYLVCKLRKWDGTSETEIASCQSSGFSATGGSDSVGCGTIVMSVPQTHFNKGDQIRLTTEVWATKSGAGGSGGVVLTYDANDAEMTVGTKTLSAGSTLLAAAIPYKINP